MTPCRRKQKGRRLLAAGSGLEVSRLTAPPSGRGGPKLNNTRKMRSGP